MPTKWINGRNSNSDLHLVRSCTACALDIEPTPVFDPEPESLSAGCWCFSAHEQIPTSETTHQAFSQVPPLFRLPLLSYSVSLFPAVSVYSFPLHFFLCVFYWWVLKFRSSVLRMPNSFLAVPPFSWEPPRKHTNQYTESASDFYWTCIEWVEISSNAMLLTCYLHEDEPESTLSLTSCNTKYVLKENTQWSWLHFLLR